MMNDIDVKSLWKSQQTPAIDLSVIRKKVRYFRLRRLVEACAVIFLLILAMVFGIFIWIYWSPLLLTTKAGIVFLSIGFMLPVLSYGKLLHLYYRLKIDVSNIDYMDGVLKIKRQEHKLQNIVLYLYFSFLSFGFGLYAYEYTFSHSFYFGIIAYSILLIWIAINWFVIRPHIIEKRNRKFADFIENIEAIRNS